MTTLQTQKLAQGSQQNKPLDEQMNNLSLKQKASKKKAKTRAKNARYQANKMVRITEKQKYNKGKTSMDLCNDIIETLRLLGQPEVKVVNDLDNLPSESEDDLESESEDEIESNEKFESRVVIVWSKRYLWIRSGWKEYTQAGIDFWTSEMKAQTSQCPKLQARWEEWCLWVPPPPTY
jgi:hypothetical protein